MASTQKSPMNSEGTKSNSASSLPPKPAELAPHPPPSVFGSQLLAWGVLIVALAASVGGWYISRVNVELGARRQFDEEASRIISVLRERLLVYQDVLHGAVGLYAASYSVERSEWRAYFESLPLDKRFPRIGGVGFFANVPPARTPE